MSYVFAPFRMDKCIFSKKHLKIIRMYSAKKGPAPWNLFLTPAPRPLQVTLFGW